MKLKEIIEYLEHFAPPAWQEDWDNAGLQIGDIEKNIKKIVLALDADERALRFCIDNKADLLITHHPLIFSGIKTVRYHYPEEKILADYIKNDIAVYSMHTNIDKVPWGTNFALAAELELETSILEEPLFPEFDHSFKHLTAEFKAQFQQKITGFVSLAKVDLSRFELYKRCKEYFEANVNVNFEVDKRVNNLAISGGSFDKDWIDKLYYSGIDTLLTGEMKYHERVLCRERDIAVIELGHDISENPVIESFDYLLKTLRNSKEESSDLEIIKFDRMNYKII